MTVTIAQRWARLASAAAALGAAWAEFKLALDAYREATSSQDATEYLSAALRDFLDHEGGEIPDHVFAHARALIEAANSQSGKQAQGEKP